MITWMQRHNKYLVWTIWIATIAFIGAGFVGWGSYKYGSKASAIGKVGDIEISKEKLNYTYSNIYNRYRDIYKGKFDEEQAKKLGLFKQAFDTLSYQSQLLNLAKEYGVTVSEKELADYISTMNAFKESGVFNKQIYRTYLQNHRIKSSTFESILRDDLVIKKLMDVLEYGTFPFEDAVVASALSLEDRIAYKVISSSDFNPDIDEKKVKQEWEATKSDYLTPLKYKLSIYWTDTKDMNVTDAEIEEFYDKNSFNYIDSEGKQLPLGKVKPQVEEALKIKKGKKQALLDYIAVKKGKVTSEETKLLSVNDRLLSRDLWKEISQSDAGTLIKPKPVGSRYATVKIMEAIKPSPMPYEEAKRWVEQKLKFTKSVDMAEKKAKEILKDIDKAELTQSDYISLAKTTVLPPLDNKESLQFLQNLFTISGKKGIIRLSKRLVVYKIVDQRLMEADQNLTASVQNETIKIKKSVFERALFKRLKEKYPVKAYVKGL